MDKSISEVVHESAKGLFEAGVFDTTTMHEFDVLCLPEVKNYTPEEIALIRTVSCKVSQAVFAKYLNTSVSTIQQWERGDKTPRGISLKLLNMVANKGLEILT